MTSINYSHYDNQLTYDPERDDSRIALPNKRIKK